LFVAFAVFGKKFCLTAWSHHGFKKWARHEVAIFYRQFPTEFGQTIANFRRWRLCVLRILILPLNCTKIRVVAPNIYAYIYDIFGL